MVAQNSWGLSGVNVNVNPLLELTGANPLISAGIEVLKRVGTV
jgi:hypothetical protein